MSAYSYDYINRYNGFLSPSTEHTSTNATSKFFTRYLLQDVMSVWKWTIPDWWSKNYFLYTLYCNGFIAIVKTDKYGVIPQWCSLHGYNVFYQPTHAIISNPLISGILEPRIGEQCELIVLQPDYGGVLDIVTKYADIMAMTVQTAGCNIMASKLAYVFNAKNKASAETFKKLFDKISSGDIAVVQDVSTKSGDSVKSWDTFSSNLKENYIAGDLLLDLQKWKNLFYTEIGIPNCNVEKKERLIKDEVNANNSATLSKVSSWLENCKKCCDKVNLMFPDIKINVEWRDLKDNGCNINNGNVSL